MKKVIICLLFLLTIFVITGCSLNKERNKNISDNSSSEVINSVKVVINDIDYKIDLEDNETTRSFVNLLPKKFNMIDLNGNEKYVYLDKSIPTNTYYPEKIYAGDVMLFGSNCLVIFYKSFNTSYGYTKIGHINDLPDLGMENIIVSIEK